MKSLIVIPALVLLAFSITPAFAEDESECGFFCWLSNLFSWIPESTSVPQIQLNIYDCAKQYDKMATFVQTARSTNPTPTQYASMMADHLENTHEFIENRCWITVQSWAHDSDFEHQIWQSDWQFASWHNQVVIGEVQCDSKACNGYKKDFESSKEQIKEYRQQTK